MNAEEVELEIAGLYSLTRTELRRKWAELFGTACYSNGRDFLIRRIAWRLRNQLEGGLSERALAHAHNIADQALIRRRPSRYHYMEDEIPQEGSSGQPSPPQAGRVISREYKGRIHEVTVLPNDRFAYEGKVYDTLTTIAWKITGYQTSGNKFFKLPAKKRTPPKL